MPLSTSPLSPFLPARSRLARHATCAIASSFALCVLLASCGAPIPGISRPTVAIDSLAEIEAPDRSVSVAGTVVRRVALVEAMAYLLEDDTGSVWVRTDRPLSEAEQQVTTTGTIAVLETGERYLLETEREATVPEAEQ